MSAIPRPFVLMGMGQGGTYKFADGTAAAPSITFASDQDTGFYRSGADQIAVTLGGTAIFSFNTTGAINSTTTIGLAAGGSNQNITLTPSGTGIVSVATALSVGATSTIGFTGRTSLRSTADGVLTIWNAAQTDFTRLQFGGTDGNFPAIKRSTTNIHFRLADDSDWTYLFGSGFVSNKAAANGGAGTVCYGATTAATVGAAGGASALPATPLGYIIVNVAGTTAKIPYYNN